MSEPFMVKVQRSIANNMGYPTVLVYDNSHQVEWEGKPPKDFKQKELKAYWWAFLTKNKKIELQGKPYKDEAEGESLFEQFDYPTMNAKEKP